MKQTVLSIVIEEGSIDELIDSISDAKIRGADKYKYTGSRGHDNEFGNIQFYKEATEEELKQSSIDKLDKEIESMKAKKLKLEQELEGGE